MSCVSVFKETQDIDTATRRPDWVENGDGHYVPIERPRKDGDMNLNERADEAMQSPAVWQIIETYWAEDARDTPDPLPSPEPNTPAWYAMILADLLAQRQASPQQQAIMDKYRPEPYDPERNAAAVVECLEALTTA